MKQAVAGHRRNFCRRLPKPISLDRIIKFVTRELLLPACLYLVGTPIGNLADLSARVKEVLGKCDLVLAEDTRVSVNLLRHLQLKKQLLSCHEYNEEVRAGELEEWVAEGKQVALVSDAGMPLVSDPGYKLVRRAIELGITICPIAGPSAVLMALIGSGLPCDRFAFEGFLPDKPGDRRRRLQKIRDDDRTLIFFVALSNLEQAIGDMLEVFGDRPSCLAREITKMYEEFIRDDLSGLLKTCRTRELKGEFVLVVQGLAAERKVMSEDELCSRVAELMEAGGRLKDVAALLSAESGWPSSRIYKLGLSIQNS